MARVLLVSWTQSGQVARASAAFTRPFREAGHEVVEVRLRPVQPYPFPWKVSSFFGVFPETVLGRPDPIERVAAEGDFDLVILAAQVWFLSPSQPFQALLTGPDRELVRGRRVLTLMVCRNMWISGWQKLVRLVQAAGGVVTDNIVATHGGSVMASYFTTLYWMLSGKKKVAGAQLGVAEDSLARLTRLGGVAAARVTSPGALLAGESTHTVSYPHALGEQIARRLFPILARVIAATSAPGSTLRGVWAYGVLAFVLSHVFGLLVPCFTAWFLFGSRIRRWLDAQARLPVG